MQEPPTNNTLGVYLTKGGVITGIALGALWWLAETIVHCYIFRDGPFGHCFLAMDANELWMRSLISVMIIITCCYVVSERIYKKKARKIIEGQRSRLLCGILPICAHCKKIRGSDNRWHKIEQFITEHTGVEFTHGICPDCIEKVL